MRGVETDNNENLEEEDVLINQMMEELKRQKYVHG